MNMTKEQVQAAIAAGLAITNPESEILLPMKHASGAVILHQLLLAIGSGQVQLNSAEQPPAPGKPPGKPGKKTPRKKAPRKKASRKK